LPEIRFKLKNKNELNMGSVPLKPLSKIKLCALAALFNLILFVVHVSAQTQVNPGRVVGNISFVNVPSAVSSYLSANPVIVYPTTIPESFPVRLYQSVTSLPAATIYYTPINATPDTQTYTAGSFDIYPNVEPAGSDFILQVDSIALANGAKYRLGSLEIGSPSYRVCQGVLPLTNNPNGTICNIAECAVLPNLNVRFVGTPNDLNALDRTYPVTCNAITYVNEVAGSQNFAWQAASETAQYTVDTLKTTGALLPMLIRASNSPVKVEISCEAKIRDGETGFVINPLTDMTPFGAVKDIGSFTCGAQPGSPIDVNITIAKTAGILEGLFDVSGHDETRAEIRIVDLPYYYYTNPPLVPTGNVPTVPWKFEGIPAGSHEISAKAIVDGGNQVLEFPHRASFNQKVTITAQQTTNIGSTFIAKPNTVKGKLVFVDPGGDTDLKGIQTGPLLDFYGSGTSHMEAVGVDAVASNTLACIMRSSGVGGRSLGRLIGTYDLSQNTAEFSYELLLAGLSPENGAVNGTSACPAPWRISGAYTHMITETVAPNTGHCYSTIEFDQYFPLRFDVNAEPLQFPEQKICFGKLRLDLHLNPNLGSIYAPFLYIYQEGSDVASNEFGTIYSFGYGYAYGTPYAYSQSASTATVSATLPEGLRYRIYPYVMFRPASQPSGYGTYIYMPPFTFPSEGFLGCSEMHDICAMMNDEEGNYSILSISFPSDTDYCLTDGNLQLNISVNLSDGSNVARVGYLLDSSNIDTATLEDPNAVILCSSNCGPNPDYVINISSLSPGSHSLTIIAVAANTCITKRTYNFHVQSEPIALQCPASFTVELLPDETSISTNDPRVANQLVPTVSGGCNLPITPSNDIPDEFLVGQTTVNFWLLKPQVQTCSTVVTVKSVERVISFISDDTLTGEQVIKKHSFLDDSVDLTTYSHPQPYHFEYNSAGNRIAVIPNDTGLVTIIDTETGSIVNIFSVQASYKLYDIDFNPLDATKYAIVGSANSDPDQHAIFIFQGNTQLSRFDLPLFPAGLRISRPLIAWSPDGTKISATFTDPASAVNQYGLWVSEWNVVDNKIVLPPNGMYQMRPNLQKRESIREMVYQDGDWRVIGTNATITRAIKRTGIEQMVPICVAENADMDLTPDGKSAVYIYTLTLEPLHIGRVYGVSPLDRNAVPNVYAGPIINNAKSVAISSDATFVAVATTDKVLVYSFPDFELVKGINAVFSRNLEFKPFAP